MFSTFKSVVSDQDAKLSAGKSIKFDAAGDDKHANSSFSK